MVRRLLSSPRVQAESVLLTAAARAALADVLAAHAASLPIYVGSPAVLSEVAGFPIHRGCVAIGRRHEIPAVEDLVPAGEKAVLLLALDGLGDADNVGGLVRCAKAFGADAVVVGPTTVDPFYRKAIRTSMGAVFDVPSCRVDDLGAVLSGCRARGSTSWCCRPTASRSVVSPARRPAGPCRARRGARGRRRHRGRAGGGDASRARGHGARRRLAERRLRERHRAAPFRPRHRTHPIIGPTRHSRRLP